MTVKQMSEYIMWNKIHASTHHNDESWVINSETKGSVKRVSL